MDLRLIVNRGSNPKISKAFFGAWAHARDFHVPAAGRPANRATSLGKLVLLSKKLDVESLAPESQIHLSLASHLAHRNNDRARTIKRHREREKEGARQREREREREGENQKQDSTQFSAPTFVVFIYPRQVLTVKFQRGGNVLREGFGMFLASVHEMEQYALYLRSAPSKAAGLLSSSQDTETKDKIIDEMRQEWELVQALESVPSGSAVLKANCNYSSFQCYRELLAGLEKSKWVLTDECRALVASWFPAYCWSAGIESVFADMQDACKRSSRSDCGSLPNLHAVGVRCLQNRLCVPEEAPDHLQLEPDDWLGPQSLGVKSKAFSPSSAPACSEAILSLWGLGSPRFRNEAFLSVLYSYPPSAPPEAETCPWTTS